jgi:hypothetical protein
MTTQTTRRHALSLAAVAALTIARQDPTAAAPRTLFALPRPTVPLAPPVLGSPSGPMSACDRRRGDGLHPA